MSLIELCRLCLEKDNLVWIFDKRFENANSMKDVVFITTGVEIHKTDIISQKICNKCCQISIKMFQFRSNSLKNDKYLRERSREYLKKVAVKIPNTDVTIKNDTIRNEAKNIELKKNIKTEGGKSFFKIHSSVTNLFNIYPNIKLPTMCLKSDITPFVSMLMDEVENYFKIRKLDINKYMALKPIKIGTKRTLPLPKPTSKIRIISTNEEPTKDKTVLRSSQINLNDHGDKSVHKCISCDYFTSSVSSKENDQISKSIENILMNKKRKHSEIEDPPSLGDKSDATVQTENKKPSFIESLGLTPKVIPGVVNGESSSVLSYVDKSVPLHICDICNSIQYHFKDLKKHKMKHLRCQFCKTNFKTMESKTNHITNVCIIKKMMNNLPNVELVKIECDVQIRRRYPEAFKDFPPLQDEHQDNYAEKHITAEDDVIEIISDDEDTASIACNISTETGSNSTNNKAEKQNCVVTANSVSSPQIPPTSIKDNDVVIKPDIKIKNSYVMDKIDTKLSDLKIMKELLSNRKKLKTYRGAAVQTDIPGRQSVTTNPLDHTTEFKNLKPQLFVYKVPVVIKNGHFKVYYSYDIAPKPPKKLCLWNDLTPVDIKNNARSTVTNINSTVLSSTSIQNPVVPTTTISQLLKSNVRSNNIETSTFNNNSSSGLYVDRAHSHTSSNSIRPNNTSVHKPVIPSTTVSQSSMKSNYSTSTNIVQSNVNDNNTRHTFTNINSGIYLDPAHSYATPISTQPINTSIHKPVTESAANIQTVKPNICNSNTRPTFSSTNSVGTRVNPAHAYTFSSSARPNLVMASTTTNQSTSSNVGDVMKATSVSKEKFPSKIIYLISPLKTNKSATSNVNQQITYTTCANSTGLNSKSSVQTNSDVNSTNSANIPSLVYSNNSFATCNTNGNTLPQIPTKNCDQVSCAIPPVSNTSHVIGQHNSQSIISSNPLLSGLLDSSTIPQTNIHNSASADKTSNVVSTTAPLRVKNVWELS